MSEAKTHPEITFNPKTGDFTLSGQVLKEFKALQKWLGIKDPGDAMTVILLHMYVELKSEERKKKKHIASGTMKVTKMTDTHAVLEEVEKEEEAGRQKTA